jgi:hypothetical protein
MEALEGTIEAGEADEVGGHRPSNRGAVAAALGHDGEHGKIGGGRDGVCPEKLDPANRKRCQFKINV